MKHIIMLINPAWNTILIIYFSYGSVHGRTERFRNAFYQSISAEYIRTPAEEKSTETIHMSVMNYNKYF